MSELKDKAVHGMIWGSVERFSVQGVSFVVMIVMARLLMPKDYGLIGMLAIFMAVAQSLIDSGFSQALIRKLNRTETDNSTVFYFNIVVSVLLYLLFFIAAPYVAAFYKEPLLAPVMRVLCLSIVINSLAVVQRAIYTIRIDFKTQAKASLSAAILSGIIGIFLAYSGWGVWALVWQQLVNFGTNTLLLWVFSSWRPKRLYSWQSFRELFGFGSKLMFSGLLDCTYSNLYPIVIGKMFSATDLGYYTRASHFAMFPSAGTTGIIQRVTYPLLCKLQNDDDRLAICYRRLLRLSAYAIFPIMVGMSALSEPFILIFIGEKWTYCSLLLGIICFSMMWYPIHAINLNLLQVKGRSDLFLRLEVIKKFMGVIILCIAIPFGLVTMCYGNIVTSLIALVINTYYTGKLIRVGFVRQMRDLLPCLLLCAVMFAGIHIVILFFRNIYLQLIVGILTGIGIYLIGSKLFRFPEFEELVNIIKRK